MKVDHPAVSMWGNTPAPDHRSRRPRRNRAEKLAFGLTLLVSLATLVTAACAPSVQGPGAQGPGSQGGSTAQSAPKLLRMGITVDAEPTDGGIFGARSAGGFEIIYLFNAGLTVYDARQANPIMPHLAERVPTLDNGDWKLLPDGKMELTWKLRKDVRWHDGTPLVAEDVVLGLRAGLNPEIGGRGTRVLGQIDEVATPDPQTLVMRWKDIYIFANDMGLQTGLVPLPRHRFAALMEAGDTQAFLASPYLTDEWIGLGPYRLTQWLRGSFIESVANDDYFLGRPKIDRVTVKYFGDTRALLAAALAGDVEVVPVGSMKEGEASVLKTQWTAGEIIISPAKLRIGRWQWIDPNAPWVQDVRVRQALVKLLDRHILVETLQGGLSDVDDISLLRTHPAYQLAKQKGLPNLSDDSNEAHRLLTGAGLTRGPDGIYRTQSGAPVAMEMIATGDIQTNVQELITIASVWKDAGLDPTTSTVPTTATRRDADEMRAIIKGVSFTSTDLNYLGHEGYLSPALLPSSLRPQPGWNPGPQMPAFDDLYLRLLRTVNLAEQHQIAADMVKFSLDNMLYLPLTYSSDVAAAAKTVRGVTGVMRPQPATAWNIHEWSMP